MGRQTLSDEELLASHELGSFAVFYRAHIDELLGFFCRRTRDPELAADLTAKTFAAALAGRRRFRPEAGSATAWLYGIATKQLASAQRRAAAERRARWRLGMERLELVDADIERINALGESISARAVPGDDRYLKLRTVRRRYAAGRSASRSSSATTSLGF